MVCALTPGSINLETRKLLQPGVDAHVHVTYTWHSLFVTMAATFWACASGLVTFGMGIPHAPRGPEESGAPDS